MKRRRRNVVWYIAVAFAAGLAGLRMLSAYRNWQLWQEWRLLDPSGADAYLTFAKVDLAVALLCLCLVGLLWWLLRPAS